MRNVWKHDELRFLKLAWLIGFIALIFTVLAGCGPSPLEPGSASIDPVLPVTPIEYACEPGQRIDLPDGGFAWCDPQPGGAVG